MADMDLSAILTCAAAFVGGFAGAVVAYFIRQRGRTAKLQAVSHPLATMPLVEYSKIPEGAITSGKVAHGVITPDDLVAGDPRDDQ